MDEVDAGNIVGIVGLRDAYSGETLCDPDNIIEGFEAIKHLFEPVVTKAGGFGTDEALVRAIQQLRGGFWEDKQ